MNMKINRVKCSKIENNTTANDPSHKKITKPTPRRNYQ